MKKKMKIVLLAMAFVLLLPGLNAFAYEGGLLDQKKMIQSVGTSTSVISTVTDRNPQTGTSLSSSADKVSYTFGSPVDIGSFKFLAKDHGSVRINAYDVNNVLIKTVFPPNHNGTEIPMEARQTKRIEIYFQNNFGYSYELYEFDVFPAEKLPGNITGLTETVTDKSATFVYELPKEDFSHLKVYQDGKLIADNLKEPKLIVEGLQDLTEYTFKFVGVNPNGKPNEGLTKSIKTLETPVGEVSSLDLEAEFNRINLSWKIPESQRFSHVNIYRDDFTETSLLNRISGTITAHAASREIFETNGTYFNDLTVEPEKKYEYKITTNSTTGKESAGVTKTVTTPAEPKPVLTGTGYTKTEEKGDFDYYWNEPTEGEVKIMIGGKEYKRVAAADKKITVPKADMKYSLMGDPDVSLQPFAKFGTAGDIVKPSLNGEGKSADSFENIDLPFSPLDLLKSGNSLLMIVGGFILLALSFLLLPKLVRMIKRAFGKESEKERLERITRAKERSERVERKRSTERAEHQARSSKIAPTERQEKQIKAAPTERRGKAVTVPKTERQEKQVRAATSGKAPKAATSGKAPKAPRERRERQQKPPKAPRQPRERIRRERTPRAGRG